MDQVHGIIKWINGYLWGAPMLVLLFGTHLFLTFRLRFVQRHIWLALKTSFKKEIHGEGDVSHFGALATALAATIGTGNIVGVATAVSLGGPGAVLWCWLTGVFGFATKYGEAVLAVKYRVKTADGTMLGGPMYALERGLNKKWLAVLFCVFTSIAAFGIGNMVQSNSISTLSYQTFGIPVWVTGIFTTAITAAVILGGVKSIARVCGLLVPFMAVGYVAGCLVILGINHDALIPTILLIGKSAFNFKAAGGGFVGASVIAAARYGIARGLFSNEAGLGSAPIVARGRADEKPGAAGPGLRHRHLLGHGGDLRHDRAGSGEHHDTAPVRFRRNRRRDHDQARLQRDPGHRPDHFDGGASDLRVFDDPRLVVLRGARNGVPVRQGLDKALPRNLGHRRHGGLGHIPSPGVGPF
jgi:AGCS family alanine or glycine:cation symporter